MNIRRFFESLDARIASYDLLSHPFYKAWAAGELTPEDLQDYAREYSHHVRSFPTYLAALAIRLDEGELRQAILDNMAEEMGRPGSVDDVDRSHAELWLDFAEGMGAERGMWGHRPLREIDELTNFFHLQASEGEPEQALAAFYAYESQVPRVAQEKARGLRENYQADRKTCRYFTLHATADLYHAQVWREQLARLIEARPDRGEAALTAAEAAAQALWRALDGIQSRRMAGAA